MCRLIKTHAHARMLHFIPLHPPTALVAPYFRLRARTFSLASLRRAGAGELSDRRKGKNVVS